MEVINLINLYECDIFYLDNLVKNIVYIEDNYKLSTDDSERLVRIQYIDDNHKLKEIVGKLQDFSFVIKG